jgi:beta-lactamase superfamily II metal-dependent hydrolase
MADILVHLLDVGTEEYGDAVLCEIDGRTVLIDGGHVGDQDGSDGHPSIPEQLAQLLGTEPPHRIDLLVVSHAHEDHVGCLPWLVEHDVIRPRWALATDPALAWGRPPHDAAPDAADPAVKLAAALREEVRTEGSDDASIARLLDAAGRLEPAYRGMLDTLADRGTRVVRHGRDSLAGIRRAFRGIGFEVLGPSTDQLLVTAELLYRAQQDAMDFVSGALDASADLVAAYRAVTSGLDARSRRGAMVNMQSIVMTFAVGNRRLLFVGDMQFADPGTSNAVIAAGVEELLSAIAERAPYSFAKVSHHGSPNGLDERLLEHLGRTRTFGICAGENSADHPELSVLALIADHGGHWARTDRNGLVTISVGGRKRIMLTKGEIDDATPPDADLRRPAEPAARPVPETGAPEPPVRGRPVERTQQVRDSDDVEVITRIPRMPTRVTVTIDVEPRGAAPAAVDVPALRVGGGRALPDLLFVSNADALARNIGAIEAGEVLAAITASGHRLVDGVPSDDLTGALAAVDHRDAVGVVIVGGYDVVPSARVNCAPDALRARLEPNMDPDDFIVWSDDAYGDAGGRQLPVSRIPDGKSADVVRAALSAGGPRPGSRRSGVRNVARPFADEVFAAVSGSGDLWVSQPSVFSDAGTSPLSGDRVYVMLHGDWIDTSRFWGEDTPNNVEAINMSNLPSRAGPVVFTGCCWGALTVDTPANRVVAGRSYGVKTPGASIALGFLLAGTTAFIGCTGAHYSPTEPPFDYYGGPLHRAFWAAYDAGAAPAEALRTAKAAFAAGIPHRRDATSEAIERKLLHQYTCLGLGW